MIKKLLSTVIISVVYTYCVYGQITNLKLNDQTSAITMTSGDTLTWSYDVPNPGDTTLVEVWIDKDNSGTLNSGDFLWTYFNQIDGSTEERYGLPDRDGTKDGHVYFKQRLGLAPAHYIMYFKNNNDIKTMGATVLALASPTFTISGTVTKNGSGVPDVVLNLEGENGQNFWTGITDASGNYTIQMDSDTLRNPWEVRIENQVNLGFDIVAPEYISFTLDKSVATSYPNKNFTLTEAAATITGIVTYEDGKPVVNSQVGITTAQYNYIRIVQSDTAGVYKLGLLASDLSHTNYSIGSGNPSDTSIVTAFYTYSTIQSGDQLTHDLVIYEANSAISGRVTINGTQGFATEVYAMNADTGFSRIWTDENGYYRVKVSDKIFNYTISLGDNAQGYSYSNPVVQAGSENVDINLVPTAIEKTDGNIPGKFSLEQNYPNPFNPATRISYQLKSAVDVQLTVYNLTGRKVAVLVNQRQSAGRHTVTFRGDNLSSGVYFYRLKAGSFTSSRKMILIK